MLFAMQVTNWTQKPAFPNALSAEPCFVRQSAREPFIGQCQRLHHFPAYIKASSGLSTQPQMVIMVCISVTTEQYHSCNSDPGFGSCNEILFKCRGIIIILRGVTLNYT